MKILSVPASVACKNNRIVVKLSWKERAKADKIFANIKATLVGAKFGHHTIDSQDIVEHKEANWMKPPTLILTLRQSNLAKDIEHFENLLQKAGVLPVNER